jgi:hypothetical protein
MSNIDKEISTIEANFGSMTIRTPQNLINDEIVIILKQITYMLPIDKREHIISSVNKLIDLVNKEAQYDKNSPTTK